jgi:3-hydroxyacyl-CoA dehydrogenase
MSELVLATRHNRIGVLTVNNPPVNALSPGVPEGIAAGIDEFSSDPAIDSIVLIGAGRTFIAGADIREFSKITASGNRERGPGINPILARIESCPKPVVAAIHGTALGGGLETAMACHYRVAVPSAQLGQPEVKLGLIPGAGGTQRLPRLAGLEQALSMCVSGDPISATSALEAGIIDEIVPGDLLAGAIAFAETIAHNPPRRTRGRNDKLPSPAGAAPLLAAARESARTRQRNLIAPLAAIDAIEAAVSLPFDQGLQREAELFQHCLFSDQSKALIHVFFGEREVAKIPGIPKDTPVREIRRAAVVGAGTMGAGIAMVFSNAGIPVLLKESDSTALGRGLATIRRNYESSVKKGRISQATMDERLARIQPTLTYDGFADAGIVVEAVFEGMALKYDVFSELNTVCRPSTILASNTSTLDIDEIASATSRPEIVVGAHFFSPANVMRLLEIVRGERTSKETIATCMALARRLGKVGVLAGNCRGFIGNRMFGPYRREAQFLVEEGATPEAVDAALFDFGMAMGPLATGDLAGLDVGWRIRKEFGDLTGASVRQPRIEDRLCELGRFGQKTGAGWYRYTPDRKPQHDPETDRIISETRAALRLTPRSIAPEEIVDRTILALINEGARLLEEGIALRSVDIDIVYVTGYGFPAYRGGPMHYADTLGLPRLRARIQEFERLHGPLWTPAPLLTRLAAANGTFSTWIRP